MRVGTPQPLAKIGGDPISRRRSRPVAEVETSDLRMRGRVVLVIRWGDRVRVVERYPEFIPDGWDDLAVDWVSLQCRNRGRPVSRPVAWRMLLGESP